MATSLIEIIKEEARRAVTGDDRYYKAMPYYFKLISKNAGSVGWDGTALFPLPVAPQSLEYSMPFAVNVEPLQEGGVAVDEAGIVVASLRIEGTTGFKLRPDRSVSFSPGNTNWTGLLGLEQGPAGSKLSGQMHLWKLLNRCFDSYGELKKDPEVAPKTYLEWHNVKDQIHQIVVPRQVTVTRDRGSERVTYRYRLEMDVIGPAERNLLDEVLADDEDAGLIASLKNSVATMRAAIRSVKAAIDEVTAAVDAIRRFASNVAGVIGDVASIVRAAEDFADGVKRFIDLPKTLIAEAREDLEYLHAVLEAANTAGSEDAGIAMKKFAAIEDGLDVIAISATSSYRMQFDAKADRIDQKARRHANQTPQEAAAADALSDRAASSGGTMPIAESMGGNVRAGDAFRTAEDDQSIEIAKGRWNGFRETTVTQGDSIHSLAIRHMGSASYWRDLVFANQLRPPFISSGARLPGTLAVGDKMVVPIVKSASQLRVRYTGNPAPGASQAESLMGTDVKLTLLPTGNYGWLVDYAHGAVDAQLVSGIDNLTQGLESRMRTEKGHDLCFPDLGLPRMVGGRSAGETWMEARVSVQQQVLSDPRIEFVTGIKTTVVNDVLEIEVNARPVGFDTARVIPLTVS